MLYASVVLSDNKINYNVYCMLEENVDARATQTLYTSACARCECCAQALDLQRHSAGDVRDAFLLPALQHLVVFLRTQHDLILMQCSAVWQCCSQVGARHGGYYS